MRIPLVCLALAAALLSHTAPQTVSRADDAEIEFFEAKIRPVLVKHCYECHSADSKQPGGGLLLDHRQGLRRGGDSGPAIVPGKPEVSLLIKAIRRQDDSLKMPPKGQLPAAAIADIERWIKSGATDPRDTPPQAKVADPWPETLRRRAEWWSIQPVRKPLAPQPKDSSWSQHPIDRFILTKLEAQGLSPAEPADPRTLARRLSLVLTGLPPSPEQVETFAQEHSALRTPNSTLAHYVDSLLDSPHFGERWARHWMDVVRFSETHGNEWNYEVHHAWRYRDYLIRAFNADVPYDQFVREHIAGDLLPQPRWNQRDKHNESIIGTGFYRFGEVNHDDCIDLPSIGYDLADNQIDTLTKAFQATTVACARCHNHKLDAVSMDDYYALLGVLRSSRMASHCIDAPEANAVPKQRLRQLKAEMRRQLAAVWLGDVVNVPRYLLAAHAKHNNRPDAMDLAQGLDAMRLEKWGAALTAEKQPLEDPFQPWRLLSAAETAALPAKWNELTEQFAKEDRERSEFNRAQFASFADFRSPDETAAADWQIAGQGLQDPPTRSGDFTLHVEGQALVRAILPAGHYTHGLSDKLNGTLRSPVLPLGKKHISFQVIGQRSSAVRLVSNNCQLNYKNYRALTSADWQWITFSPPDDRDRLRTYAELMTMFDNPKFPDQLSALGGDKENYRLPWDKAAENPRSCFGITRVVLHDVSEPPKPDLAHLRPLFRASDLPSEEPPATLAEVAARYAAVITAALNRWSADAATDDDVHWLEALLRRDLLRNQLGQATRLDHLARQYRQAEAELSLPRIVAGVADGGPGIDQPVFVRGDCLRPGDAVPRRYLEVLSKPGEAFASSGSGRLELAQRIASADNPLTARVAVNRVWHHLFGAGLVRTVDDFGHVGELPSHPELLDHLAGQFVEEGWSAKKLIRSLVLTRTFQMANRPTERSRDVDPQNRLLSHYPARRLEAEAVRDAILAASGRLDRSLFGPSVQPYREQEYADRRLFPGPLDGHGRRSIYIKNNLMESPKFLAAFNLPGGKVAQGRRDVTNVPAQALALLNDPFVHQQADVWAARLIARPNDSVSARIVAMFQTTVQRSPSGDELARFEEAVQRLAELHGVPAADILKSQAVWKDIAHAFFNLSEFIYIL